MSQEKIREVKGFQCMFCGEIYNTQPEAETCWERHVQFTIEPLYNMSQEFPVEILVKKISGMTITEIATYEYKTKDKVNIPYQKVENDE